MLQPKDVSDERFNAEIHRIIGEVQLHQYGTFLDAYYSKIDTFRQQLPNNLNVRTNPVLIENRVDENLSLLELVRSDNKLLSRLLVSLASVCDEIHLLVTEARNKFYLALVGYEEESRNVGDNLKSVSGLLMTLQQIHCFINRSQQVITLLLGQLCAILSKNGRSINVTSFPEPLVCLAELLVCLLTLDTLLLSTSVKDHYLLYRRTVHAMAHVSSKINVDNARVRSLDQHLLEMGNTLFTGNILKNVFENCLNEQLLFSLKSCSLQTELMAYLDQLLNALEVDQDNISYTQIWLEANVMFVFHYYLYGNFDKKFSKRLLEVNRNASACTLAGNVLWHPETFLFKHVPDLLKQPDIKVIHGHRTALIGTKSQNLPKDSQMLCAQAYMWMLELEKLSFQSLNNLDSRSLQDKGNMLIRGIKLVKQMGELVKWITNLHADEEIPMTMSVLLSLCRLIECLKGLQFIFHKNLLPLIYVSLLVCQHLTHRGLVLIHSLKKSVTQEKSYKDQQLDILSSLALAEQALRGPNTKRRLLVAKLSISASGMSEEVLFELRGVISRLELICFLNEVLNRLCDCSFLYWHQVLLPAYFSKLVDSKVDLSRFYMFLAALTDCAKVSSDKIEASTSFYLKNNLLNPLNQMIETNLRFQTHLHLQLPSNDPFKSLPPLAFSKLLPARLSDNYISIKHEVEHYLSTMFYNLITVILHDWKTYGEMRKLALLQYNLSTVDDCLPMQTLEQGLDILEIMRNIHVFVEKYLYNMNNQVFVEEWSNNKHLNTINISHVANSIRTHGIGIMNTTVNFAYQFLQKKFFIFSQFLYDEHIKSRLLKDIRYFNEHKFELNQMYPFDRAEKFNVGIKKLGLNSDGLSYLDLFRKLITQIGNVMGYVRLIRSGGRRCLADATCFIPDLDQVDELSKLLEEEELQGLTKSAATCLQRDLNNLVENFEDATEYFKLLKGVFAPVFRNPQNIHLRNFFVIVPPLTINFVEHSLMCKEKLNKKNRVGAAFTDDGFAMGLAYIIELLEQDSSLNSIHWFQSVRQKYNQDIRNLDAQKAVASKEDSKLQQTLTLTEKRIETFTREFQLLYYCYSSARIFFKT